MGAAWGRGGWILGLASQLGTAGSFGSAGGIFMATAGPWDRASWVRDSANTGNRLARGIGELPASLSDVRVLGARRGGEALRVRRAMKGHLKSLLSLEVWIPAIFLYLRKELPLGICGSHV